MSKHYETIESECVFCKRIPRQIFTFKCFNKRVVCQVCLEHAKELFLKSNKELKELFK